MRFKTDWANLIVGSKFTVFALFYFVFEGNFLSTNPRGGGGLYLEGQFNGGVFCVTGLGGLYLVGLIHGRAHFRNFTVSTFRRYGNKVHSMYSFQVKYRTVEFILSCRFKKKVYFVDTY